MLEARVSTLRISTGPRLGASPFFSFLGLGGILTGADSFFSDFGSALASGFTSGLGSFLDSSFFSGFASDLTSGLASFLDSAFFSGFTSDLASFSPKSSSLLSEARLSAPP